MFNQKKYKIISQRTKIQELKLQIIDLEYKIQESKCYADSLVKDNNNFKGRAEEAERKNIAFNKWLDEGPNLL